MTTRAGDVEVRVQANVQNLGPGLNRARQQTEQFTKGVDQSTQRAAKGFQFLGQLAGRALGPLSMLGPVIGNVARASSSLLTPIGALGGLAGFAGLAIVAGKAIQAFSEVERETNKLSASLATLGRTSGLTLNQIERTAQGIASSTMATASSVRAATQGIIQFREISGETFDQTMRLAQDLATVGFGSLDQAARTLATSFREPEQAVQALMRAGVRFTAQQQDMIRKFRETGQSAAAQSLIFKTVEEQVGGAGAAEKKGLAGAFSRLTSETVRWLAELGKSVASFLNIENIINRIASSIPGSTQGGEFSAADRVKNIDAEIAKVQAERLSTINKIRGMQTSGVGDTTAAQQAIKNLSDHLTRLNGQLDELEKHQDTVKQQAIGEWASEGIRRHIELKEQEGERVKGVLLELDRQAEGYRRSRIQAAIHEEVTRAGIATDSAAAKAIGDKVRANDRLAHSASIRDALESEERGKQLSSIRATRDMIKEAKLELEVMQQTDPVMAELIRRREQLAFATGKQREEIEQLLRVTEQLRTLQDGAEAVFGAMGNALTDFAVQGKFEFKDLADSIIRDLLRIAMQAYVIKPLVSAIGGVGQNFLSGFGGAGASQVNSSFNVGMTGFASGGAFRVPGSGGGDRPTLVGLAPGELVQITPQHKVNGGAGTQVNIKINTTREFETQERERQGPGGINIHEVVLTEVTKAIGRGELDTPMEARFGNTPRTSRR